ncbi:hypothetical protein [Bacillus paramycoides]|nr:hypothetical protein [Bacillus paramycoides]
MLEELKYQALLKGHEIREPKIKGHYFFEGIELIGTNIKSMENDVVPLLR